MASQIYYALKEKGRQSIREKVTVIKYKMNFPFSLLVFVCVVAVVFAAVGQKGKPSKSINLPRKLRRTLRNTNDAAKLQSFLSPETEALIKSSDGKLSENLLKFLTEKAKKLKVSLPSKTWGVKQKVDLPDLVDTAVSAGTFNTLVAAVKAAGLVDTLKGKDPLTVFAPSDEAFSKLPEGTVDGLLLDIPKLTALLTFHVIPGYVTSKKVEAEFNGKNVATVNGKELAVKVGKQDKVITISGAKVVTPDIKAKNGYIHIIDSVLIPPESA